MDIPFVQYGDKRVRACIRCKREPGMWEMRSRDDEPLPLGPRGEHVIVCDTCRPLADDDAVMSFGFRPTWHRLW